MPTALEEQVIDGYYDIIFHEVFNAVEVLINAHKNVAPALILSAYTEILGGFVRGVSGMEEKENYKAFLEYMGPEYVALNNKQGNDLYLIVRSGLIHEGRIKGKFAIAPSREFMRMPDGIGLDTQPPRYMTDIKMTFYVKEYFRDFRNGVDRYFADLKDGKDSDLVAKFMKVERKA